VSDLQSDSNTTLAVFGAAAAATGLAAALKVAGITTPYMGFSLTTANLQDIQHGSQVAGLDLDYPVLAWTMVDEAARTLLKAPLTADEMQQQTPMQWLNVTSLPGDVSQIWTGYPDYATRFTKLWIGQ
jgi:ribose transport system substrate-binding protein